MKVSVCDISGMGGRESGGYEWGCQVICARTFEFLSQRKEGSEFPRFHSYKNVTGILTGDNPAAKELDDFILAHPKLQKFGMTGAMHQFGVMHGLKLFELGREKYLEACRQTERNDGDFYEFEWDDAFPEKVGVRA